jgi:hypothetical protein
VGWDNSQRQGGCLGIHKDCTFRVDLEMKEGRLVGRSINVGIQGKYTSSEWEQEASGWAGL